MWARLSTMCVVRPRVGLADGELQAAHASPDSDPDPRSPDGLAPLTRPAAVLAPPLQPPPQPPPPQLALPWRPAAGSGVLEGPGVA